jgi:predicted dehydrogenase
MHDLGAAVIGTGFIGTLHLETLRRLGLRLAGVLGSSAARGQERARALGAPRAYGSLDELLADPGVGVVHVASPNRLHHAQVAAILAAGRHVVCEKPLAMTAAEAADLVARARAAGVVAAVCYNTRFYALNHHARGMVLAGELGQPRLVTGRYHQDWLSRPSDWNWRLDPAEGGLLRAVGDIGTHWLDLTSFVAGMAPAAVCADLAIAIPERERPRDRAATFAAGAGGGAERVRVATEDLGLVLLRYPNGARGAVTVSQVSPGRKNSLAWEIAGSEASAAWESESPERLWIGRRDGPSGLLTRDPAAMNELGRAVAALPGGHVEGFADSFAALLRAVHADIAAGGRRPGSTWASFADGHRGLRLCEAIWRSAREGRWVGVDGDDGDDAAPGGAG